MTLAYATANWLTGLAASAFTPGSGPSDATRSYLNDALMSSRYVFTAAASTNTLVIDLGAARSVAGFAVLNSNIATAGGAPTFKVEGADDAGITTNVYTKAASTLNLTAPRSKEHVLQFAATSRRYWRLTWTWTGTHTLRVGELFAYAAPTVFTRLPNDGTGEAEEYFQAVTTSDVGETRAAFLGGPIRSKEFVFSDWSTANEAEWRAFFTATLGQSVPVLWVDSYEATATAAAVAEQECLYGFATSSRYQWSWADYALKNVPRLSIRSMGREVGS